MWHAAGSRWNAVQFECAQRTVVLCEFAFALHHVDFDTRLVVRRRRIRFDLAGRNRGIALNLNRHHAAKRLNAERKRRHVEQQDVLYFSGQHGALDRCAHCDNFVGVHALVRLFAAKEVANELLHFRDACRAANEHDFFDIARRKFRVLQSLLYRLHRTVQ